MKALLIAISIAITPALHADAAAQGIDQMRAQDIRVARIADAMLVSNARLCRETMPVTGLILHSADQYSSGARGLFDNGTLAVLGVVPDSPAEQAGVQPDDGIVALNDTPVSALPLDEDGHLREAAFDRLADSDTVKLTLQRGERRYTVSLTASRGCRALVEVLLGDGPNARSDGRVIQVRYDFVQSLDDEQIAVLLAHELAHGVLEHRRRKEGAGVDNESLMRHFGRNQQVNRQAEVEADRLSVHLLANAGYDPMIAARFWRSAEGVEAGGGPLPSSIYPSQEARAQMVEREVDMFLPLRQGPSWPGHLIDLRDRAFLAD